MVVSSTSSWVRPAQALVYTEEGGMKFFPPRNRGSLPRALTFRDHQEWRSAESSEAYLDLDPHLRVGYANVERLNKTDYENAGFSTYSEDADISFLLATMNSSKCDIDDPPEEYESFDTEHSQHSFNKDDDSSVECEIVVMSTPTEECIKRHKRAIKPVISPTIPSTSSDSLCYSPLLPHQDTSSLSLQEMVELCTRKMEEARAARLSQMVSVNNTDKDPEQCNQNGNSTNNQTGTEAKNNESNSERNGEAPPSEINVCSINRPHESPARNNSISNPLQLIAFDIQFLLQELNLLNENEKSDYEDWISIPTQEMEALLINCYRKTVEFVLSE